MKYLQLLINLSLFTLLYFPLFPKILNLWKNNPDYSHGPLIPIISLYFLWRKKDEFKNTKSSTSIIGLAILIVGVIIASRSMGLMLAIPSFSMLLVIFGLVYAQLGWEIAKKTLFPIFYLIFALPFSTTIYLMIAIRLRLFATIAAFSLVKLFGITAVREGNIVHLSTCSLFVANPCSGIRSLVTFMAASLAIGYIFHKSIKKRIILFFVGIILAFLINMLRLAATAIIANFLKLPEVPLSLHDTAGIISIVIGLFLLFVINSFLTKEK